MIHVIAMTACFWIGAMVLALQLFGLNEDRDL